MNILELCLSSGLGGLELYVYRASEALKKNHNVTTALLKDSKLDTYYKKHSTINRIYINRSKNPVPIINARKLAKIIDDNKIDLVHMHWGKDLAIAALAKFFSKSKPKLVYTRQMMITRYKNDIYHRFLYKQLDYLLTITKQLETLCKAFIPAKNLHIRTLYYGVTKPKKLLSNAEIQELRTTKKFVASDFIIGLFGRLEDGKGQHLLIKALAIAKNNNENIKALIVGHEMTAGYRDTLLALAKSLDVVDQIVFNDFVDNPQELMQICDCICLTTYEETFGLVLPEAMRAGITVIGSNSGGVPEIIDHHKTGLLFESRDEQNLYQQISLLYNNPELKSALAKQGKEKADDMFDYDLHFNSLDKIFTEAVKQ
ncbi:MAG: glycosyltransferase family 4 protein [Gammaproteobacteria bacterium]|nr:glycosyltransferase family 4 protein [Gammaproteobacteria bacterium]